MMSVSSTSASDLGQMQVALLADISNYLKGMQQAQQAATQTAQHVEHAAHQIESVGGALGEFAQHAMQSLTMLAEFEFLKGSFEAFGKREESIIRLTSAIDANGHSVKNVMSDYEAFTEEITHTTMQSKLEVQELLKIAEVHKLTGERAKEAVKMSIGLAEATGIGTEAAMRLAAAIQTGDQEGIEHMSRMLRRQGYLVGLTDATKIAAEAQRIANVGLDIAAKRSASAEGALHHLSLAWVEFRADLGESVAQGIMPIVEGLKELVKWFRDLPAGAKSATVEVIAFSAAVTVASLALKITVGSLATSGGALSIFAAGLAYAAFKAVTLHQSMKELNRTLAEAKAGVISQETFKKAVDAGTFGDVKKDDPMYQELLKVKLQGAEDRQKLMREQMDKNFGTKGALKAPIMLAGGFLTGDLEARKKALKEVEVQIAVLKAALEGVKPSEGVKNSIKETLFVGPEDYKGIEDATKMLDDLRNEIDSFNMSDADKKLSALMKQFNVPQELATSIHNEQERIDKMKEAKKLQEEVIDKAAEASKSAQTPMEALAGTIQDLNYLIDKGKITWDEYRRAVDKARASADKMTASQDAMAFGSSEAIKMTASYRDRVPAQAYDRGPDSANAVLKNTFGDGEIKRNIQKTADKKAIEVKAGDF